jgi:hypothetical protein
MMIFIAGFPKTATTSLYDLISSFTDSELVCNSIKEPASLSPDIPIRRRVPKQEYNNNWLNKSEDMIVVDGSTHYIYSNEFIKSIQNINNYKIIIGIRKPSSLFESLFNQNQVEGYEKTKNLSEIVESGQGDGPYPFWCDYRTLLDQFIRLDHLRRHTKQDSVFIYRYEDLRSDQDKVVREILKFIDLNVESFSLPSANKSGSVRFLFIPKLIDILFSVKKFFGIKYSFGYLNKMKSLQRSPYLKSQKIINKPDWISKMDEEYETISTKYIS